MKIPKEGEKSFAAMAMLLSASLFFDWVSKYGIGFHGISYALFTEIGAVFAVISLINSLYKEILPRYMIAVISLGFAFFIIGLLYWEITTGSGNVLWNIMF